MRPVNLSLFCPNEGDKSCLKLINQAALFNLDFKALHCKCMPVLGLEMDLKSLALTGVPVRLRPEAPFKTSPCPTARDFTGSNPLLFVPILSHP